jgi:hypothetical protein
MDNLVGLLKIQKGGPAAADPSRDPNVNLLNDAIMNIGPRRVVNALENFLMQIEKTLPLVSIGSGNGLLEFLHEKKYPSERELCCVDPRPLEWSGIKFLFKVPKYKKASDMPHTYVNNCVMLLNWPYPGQDSYDVDAIDSLKPKFFCIIRTFGLIGAASGAYHKRFPLPYFVTDTTAEYVIQKRIITKKGYMMDFWKRITEEKDLLPAAAIAQRFALSDRGDDFNTVFNRLQTPYMREIDCVDDERISDESVITRDFGVTKDEFDVADLTGKMVLGNISDDTLSVRQNVLVKLGEQFGIIGIKNIQILTQTLLNKAVELKVAALASSTAAAFSKACQICGTTENTKACAKCKSVFYCGSVHQKEDWKRHKLECAELTKTAAASKPAAAKPGGYRPHTWFHHCY